MSVLATLNRNLLLDMAEAAREGKLVFPVDGKIPLAQVGAGQAAAEKCGVGKVLFLA